MSDIGADPSRGPQEHWKVVFGLPVGWIEAGNKLCLARQEPEIRRLTVPDLRCLTRLGCVHSTGKWPAAKTLPPVTKSAGVAFHTVRSLYSGSFRHIGETYVCNSHALFFVPRASLADCRKSWRYRL
jgi:hypothetical protein